MRNLRALTSFVLVVIGLFSAVSPVYAAVDVTPTELQNAGSLLKPDGSAFGALSGFSSFYLRGQTNLSGGLATRYQALLLSDPWVTSGLPELQLSVIAYTDQEAAETAFSSYKNSTRFSDDDLSLVSTSSHALFYSRAEGGGGVDLLKSISTNSSSYHWLERNGNVLIQGSLYLASGSVHSDTRSTYEDVSTDSISSVLSKAVDSEKLSLGLLFPPEDPLFSASSEKASLNLSGQSTLPKNGSLSLDIYVSDPGAARGTVLDSSGLLSASDGDLYLYINGEGKLLAGLYAPAFDADCTQSAGWYSVSTSTALYPYEWNHVTLRFGVEGFGLQLNGGTESFCSVSQERSSRPLYLGDYPEDSVSEGMIGVVDHVSTDFSLDSLGRNVDTVLSSQLFLDLSPTDVDFAAFKILKEKKVFMGSGGLLKADSPLNRAAMVKVLLRAFGYSSSSASVSFSDVPSTAWYKKYLAKAVEIGMVKGRSDGTFGGGDIVTRAEFFTMLERVDSDYSPDDRLTGFEDVNENDWYQTGARYAEAKGFIVSDYFYPTQTVTRRDAARVLADFLTP